MPAPEFDAKQGIAFSSWWHKNVLEASSPLQAIKMAWDAAWEEALRQGQASERELACEYLRKLAWSEKDIEGFSTWVTDMRKFRELTTSHDDAPNNPGD